MPFDPGTPTGLPIFASGGDGYNVPFDGTGVAPLTTEQLFGKVIYDFSNGVRGYVQGLYSSSEVEYTSLVGATSATIYGDNAYPPAALQAGLAPTDSVKLAHYLCTGPKPFTEEETECMMFAAGLYNWQRTYVALDAVDDGTCNIVCRASLRQMAMPMRKALPVTTQDLITFEVVGSAFTLPAGPVDMAFGAE